MKQKEFFDLAEEMEKACGDWENSEGMSKGAYEKLLREVEQRERSRRPVRRMKKRYVVALAAALVLVMGMGVVGDRAWISDSSDLERETEVTTKVDNEDKTDVLLEEEKIYQEIADKLGTTFSDLAVDAEPQPVVRGYIEFSGEIVKISSVEDIEKVLERLRG